MEELKQSPAKENSTSEDPPGNVATLLVVGILIVILTSAILAVFLYSKLNHG